MEEIKNLSINTLKVEIKTLQINGKQMTLSVFKQITNELLDDFDEPIGWVKYKINNCDCWLVFVRNGILHRCSFYNYRNYPNDQIYIAV